MKPTIKLLNAALAASIGITTTIGSASAATLPNGNYDLVIKTTPTFTYNGVIYNDIGTDGAWNSSFTFGGLPGTASQPMTDTGATVMGADSISRGSGIDNDSYAGILNINIKTDTFDTLTFSKDTIFNTAGGDFAQYVTSPTLSGDTTQFIGTINKATGGMTLQPTRRYGAINAPDSFYDKKWQVDNCNDSANTDWNVFTTGVSAPNTVGPIKGTVLQDVSDVNGDGRTDTEGVLVTGGNIGNEWGSFFCAAFYETWRINLLARAINDTGSATILNDTVISVLQNDGTGSTGGATSQLAVINSTDGALGTTTITDSGKTVTYSAGDTTGSDSFTYTIQDGRGVQSTATVNITVTANPVAAGDDGPFNSNQGAAALIPISDLTSNDASTAGSIDDATLTPISPTSAGGTVSTDGTNVTYTPPSTSFVGIDSFTYTVKDDASPPNSSDPATVSMNILAYGLTDVGSYEPGDVAVSVGSRDGRITAADLQTDTDVGDSCIGGCFNFDVTGIGMATTAQIVPPPLNIPIVEGLTDRKFINGGWQDFDTTADEIASAPISGDGGCPDAASLTWVPLDGATTTVANAGHVCLKYTITNDGPNDNNTAEPGVISDPSGLSAPIEVIGESPLLKDISDSGCTIGKSSNTEFVKKVDWLLIGSFLGVLGWLRRKSLGLSKK